VKHPRTKNLLAFVAPVFSDHEQSPKERDLIDICRQAKAAGRKVLVYSVYSGTRDTMSRLKTLLTEQGFKVAVLRANIETSRREDWIAEQLDRGIDVLITNPDLVKTGLDLLEFPTIVFLQSGYNVYTLQQAARRSWRIGQKLPVKVIFLGYAHTSQIACLELMAKKIAVSQSTSGDVPDSGLDVLNQDGDSIEIALARRLAT
jgi:SNF2 family DNA or RNA helicase